MRTYIYIDGFNFYYRAVKNTPYKWLDFKSLLLKLLPPKNQIIKINYYTAVVSGKRDPQQPIRQQTYFRALENHIPEISIYYGSFIEHEVLMPLGKLVKPLIKNPLIQVIKSEEKGSDVNFAVHLLNDAWLDKYDCAVIVSNDSDLSESIKIVKYQLKKIIGIIIPGIPRRIHPSRKLLQYADFIKQISNGYLKGSQLPSPIPGTNLIKPSIW